MPNYPTNLRTDYPTNVSTGNIQADAETNAANFALNAANAATNAKNIPIVERITDFTSKWFQVVYTANTNNEDLAVTFYMIEPYRSSVYNSSSNTPTASTAEKDDLGNAVTGPNGEKYTNEGNYSQSIARTNLNNDFSMVKEMFPQLSESIAKPSQLPAAWQASVYQTGTNEGGAKWTQGTGVGASGWGFNSSTNNAYYSLNNGLDGKSAGCHSATGWQYSQIQSNYDDEIWLPSAFETLYMGKDKDSADYESFLTSYVTASSALSNYRGTSSLSTSGTAGSVRHGLWRLNGYDRAFQTTAASYAWLRSGHSYSGGTSHARFVSFDGYGNAYNVNYANGLRPALHLTTSSLAVASNVTITYNVNGGGTVSPSSKTVVFNSTTALDVPTRTGYTFDGWFDTAANANNNTVTGRVTIATGALNTANSVTNYIIDGKWVATANQTVYARWTAITYSVTYNLNGGTGAENTTYTVEAALTLATPTRENYVFDGWFESSTFTGTKVTSITAGSTGNKVYYAKWTPNNHTITYHMNGYGAAPTGLQHAYGSATSLVGVLPVNPPISHRFLGWSLTNGGAIVTSIPANTVDPQLWANWEQIILSITYHMNGYGNAPTSPKEHVVGVEISLEGVLPSDIPSNQNFLGWSLTKDGVIVAVLPANNTDPNLWANWRGIDRKCNCGCGGETVPPTNIFDTTWILILLCMVGTLVLVVLVFHKPKPKNRMKKGEQKEALLNPLLINAQAGHSALHTVSQPQPVYYPPQSIYSPQPPGSITDQMIKNAKTKASSAQSAGQRVTPSILTAHFPSRPTAQPPSGQQ